LLDVFPDGGGRNGTHRDGGVGVAVGVEVHTSRKILERFPLSSEIEQKVDCLASIGGIVCGVRERHEGNLSARNSVEDGVEMNEALNGGGGFNGRVSALAYPAAGVVGAKDGVERVTDSNENAKIEERAVVLHEGAQVGVAGGAVGVANWVGGSCFKDDIACGCG